MDMQTFRWLFIAALLANALPGVGYAGPSAARGVVESVGEVPLPEPFGFPGIFELTFKPSTADELVVRLDDGQVIRIVHTGAWMFEPGERVQVLVHPYGTRVERADDSAFLEP
jgi:hypothetical protein